MATGLKCLIVGQQVVHTDVCPSTPIETSLCGARPLEAIQPICIRCLWDYTALIHPLHPSLTLLLPPASPPSPHSRPPTSSSRCWQHLPVINDNPSPPLATVWEHFIGEVTRGERESFIHSSSFPSSVFYSTDSGWLRKKTPEGAEIKDTLEKRGWALIVCY